MATRTKKTDLPLFGLAALILYAIPNLSIPVDAKAKQVKSTADEQAIRNQAA